MRYRLLKKSTIHLGGTDVYQRAFTILNRENWSKHIVTRGKKEKIEYYNIPCAFDIETSSFYQNGEKRATMYIWQFGICGYNFTGRTWQEYLEFVRALHDVFHLDPKSRRLFVGVHNLSYEFQWLRLWHKWLCVFAIDSRKPAYGVTMDGLEFRCTYLLTGKSLQMVGEDLTEIKCSKLHSLDYSLPRHYLTQLKPREMQYCINDIMIVQCFLFEKILQDGNITRIPITKTSYVRSYLRKNCLYGGNKSHKKSGNQFLKYRRLMKALTIDGMKEYTLLKQAFMGGFTHSNPKHTNKFLEGVASIDYTSDYPYCLIAYPLFPMSKGEFVRPRTVTEFEHNLKYYACIFELHLYDVEATFFDDFYIPASKCRCLRGEVQSNGRIVSAKELVMTMTELDYDIIKNTYRWNKDKTETGYFIRYRRGYLPTPLVESILGLYKDKTELKGVDFDDSGRPMQAYYQLRKELLNSCYGAIVTDILRLENVYESDHWLDEMELLRRKKNPEEEIQKYNEKVDRIFFYPWGIYCTAIARHNLWGGILEFADDYIYSDTDSLKVLNIERHQRYIDNYNRHCEVLLDEAMKYHGLDPELTHPKNNKGEVCWLGKWDFEGVYDGGFKTLGSKRYCFIKRNKKTGKKEFWITVSGLNKKVASPYIKKKSHNQPFDFFTDDMYIPKDYTGKLCHTYIDRECSGVLTDLNGLEAPYYEKSYIHLEPEDYELSISRLFMDYLTKISDRADAS